MNMKALIQCNTSNLNNGRFCMRHICSTKNESISDSKNLFFNKVKNFG